MSLKIGINSLFLIPGKVGGTEVFFRNQIRELAKIKTDINYVIYANNENKDTFKGLPKNFKIFDTGINATNRMLRVFWEQAILPIRLYLDKIEILHSPGYTSPLITHCKKITTIFDLNYYYHPEDFSFLERIVYSILVPLSAYASSRVIVHSKKSKQEMIKVLGMKGSKIEVIYGGVSNDFKKQINHKTALSFVKSFGIQPPFILANSTSHPHKNLSTLISAFILLSKKPTFKHNLVLIGIPGRAYKNLYHLIDKNKIKDRIQFTNIWIDNKNMKYFNHLADIFVVPSLYEGFGLPIVEAMACGTPLIASKYSCIPEIVGNGGIVVDVKKPHVIAKSILDLLRNKKERLKISKLERERANFFSWSKFGKKIYNLYLNV